MNYEALLQEAANNDIYVMENASFESNSKGLINNDVIGLSKELDTNNERACILAEELGHYHTSAGNIVDLKNISNAKQERVARLWAYNKLIGLQGIIEAHQNRCTTKHEIAEFLGVTEVFLDDAIKTYTEKYGAYTKLDNYIIFFIPNVGVMELIS